MKQSISYVVAALSVAAALLFTSTISHAQADSDRAAIRVSGEGTVSIAPDVALLALTVKREAATAREALDANSAAMKKVIAAMEAEGIAGRDLQTVDFAIQPKYHYPATNSGNRRGPPELVGYTVRNSLNVRVRDIRTVGQVLDTSVSLGVNEGGSIHFTNADPSAALAQARTQAVAAALAKAKTLASAADVKLGAFIEISEHSSVPQPMRMARSEAMMADAAGSVPVATGENSYRVQVNIALEIVQ